MRARFFVLSLSFLLPVLAVSLVLLLPGAVAGQGGYEFLLQPAEVFDTEDISQPPSTIACDYSQGGGVISCTADIEPYSSAAAIVNVVLDSAPLQAVALLIETDTGTGYWSVGYGGDGRPVWWRNAGGYGFPLGNSVLLDYGPSGSSVGLPGAATFPFDASEYKLGSNYSPGRPAGCPTSTILPSGNT